MGTPIDLSQVALDTYVVAGNSDHISPWRAVYRTTDLLGAEPRFVLSTSGHIVAIVNPPGNAKAKWQTAEHNPPDPDEWLEASSSHEGSGWEDWTEWLGERSREPHGRPRSPGEGQLPMIGAAPGSYVHQRL